MSADPHAAVVVRLYVGTVDRHGRDVPEPVVRAALAEIGLQAWTMYRASGRWRGADEPSIVLESILQRVELPGAMDDARRLARTLSQESVMVLVQDGAVAYVAGESDEPASPDPASKAARLQARTDADDRDWIRQRAARAQTGEAL